MEPIGRFVHVYIIYLAAQNGGGPGSAPAATFAAPSQQKVVGGLTPIERDSLTGDLRVGGLSGYLPRSICKGCVYP